MNVRTFENELFPHGLRHEYARVNVRCDFSQLTGDKKRVMAKIADELYPGWRTQPVISQIGMASIMLPVGCNATCPGICYTNAEQWSSHPEHLSFSDWVSILDTLKLLECKVVRIIGEGEPLLYPHLNQFCQHAIDRGMQVVIFSNGLILPRSFQDAYQKGKIHVYVKLWSELQSVQTDMVAPKSGFQYKYADGTVGSAPVNFYRLHEINPANVGFQVMLSQRNHTDVQRIVTGLKTQVPLLVEPFIMQGTGKVNFENVVIDSTVPVTKDCGPPPRSSYHAVINSCGRLQAGTFVTEGAIPFLDRGYQHWSECCVKHDIFYQARYTPCPCFCQQIRQRRNDSPEKD